MKFTQASLPGVWIIDVERHGDSRGYFAETFRAGEFERHVGAVDFVQENESMSRRGVVRGLHYQAGSSAQAKLVRVVDGTIVDVVAEFAVHPVDSVDSIWVKLAHTQDEQGWIREVELKRSFVPTDSISQAIHLFSDTHASYFVVIFALFVGVWLLRAFRRKQLQMVYFNDIDSVYPLFLCLLMAFSATIYESIQVFTPETWEHFYFNPTLSPFKVPFILSVFLLSIWLFLIVALAVLDDLFRQLTPAAAIFYLLGLMSCCIFCYFFFILMTHIYIGYLFLAFFMLVFAKKVHRNIGYKYRCGRCGEKLKQKGVCPHCGAINE